MTPETKVKQHMRRRCRQHEWMCYTAPVAGVLFWPDKMTLCGEGVTWFCEVKAVGMKHDKTRVEGQKKKLRDLHALGHPASFCVGNDEIDDMISRILAWMIDGRTGVAPCMGIYE